MFGLDIVGVDGLFGLVRQGNSEDWFFEIFSFSNELITRRTNNTFAISQILSEFFIRWFLEEQVGDIFRSSGTVDVEVVFR